MAAVTRFSLGSYQCAVLSDGGRDIGANELFPGVSADRLAAMLAETGTGATVPVGYNVLLIDTGGQKIMVDSGRGGGSLLESLAAVPLLPAEINTVLVTHGDGDHIGGLGDFSGAQVYLPRLSWGLWTAVPSRAGMVQEFTRLFADRAPAAELAAVAERRAAFGTDTLPALRNRLTLVDVETGEEAAPGVRFLAAPGHRSDHFAVEIESQGARLLHVVDSLRHPLQVAHPEVTSYIDSHPRQMVATTRALLARAADQGGLVFATHLPFPGLGRVRRAGEHYTWHPLAH